MESPFLSIAILTHNRSDTLRETLESIAPQVTASGEVEIVVCDNASSDSTPEVVRRFATEYPVIRYFRHDVDTGFDGNVVTALEQSRGTYVAFFSDDDLAPPGHVKRLLETLLSYTPSVLYINHRPFFHDNPSHLGRMQIATGRRIFEDGQEFILFAGLGFISSLVLHRESALQFTSLVDKGEARAQLDVSYRVALSANGPFVYDGDQFALARYSYAGGPILMAGFVNQAHLLRRLTREGLFSSSAYERYLSSQVSLLPRHVFASRGRGQFVPFSQLRAIYGSRWQLYLLVLPLYFVPRAFMEPIYRAARRALHILRKVRFVKSPA